MNEHDDDQTIENGTDAPLLSDDDLNEAAITPLDDKADEPIVDEAEEDVLDDDAEEVTGEESDQPEAVADDEVTPEEVILGDELDVEAALASLVSLDDALAEHAAAETEEAERLNAEAAAIEQVNQVLQEEAERRAAYSLPRPPMIASIQRGQGASVVPAMLLMVIGAWLTFTLTTADESPPAGTITMIVMGGLGLSMLAYWFTSGRWARGAFVSGMTLLSFALVTLFLSQSDELGADGWPLFLIASAVAVLLSALLSPRVGEGHLFSGVALAIAGAAALAVTTETINQEVLDFANTVAPAVLVLVLIVLLLPRIPKRRG